MKKISKQIIKLKCFASYVIVRITYYLRLLLDSIIYIMIRNNWSLIDTFRNRDCLIVGNGPSLKVTPLARIKMLSIGMNKINLLFDKTSWRPDLIVCVNGLVIRQNRGFFNSTNIPLILPVKALYIGIKRRPNIIFLKTSNSNNFQDNIIDKGLGIGSTVTYTCLQVAAFLKVKSVNIVGVDHYYEFKDKKSFLFNQGDDPNHFDPNYFKNCVWGAPDLVGSERAYLMAKEYFDRNNIDVIDYTIDGKLRVFKKRDIKEIIKAI